MKLRDYQIEALDAIKSNYDAGVFKQLIVLPTGMGKSLVGSNIKKWLNLRQKILWCAHREELLIQAALSLSKSNPNCIIEIEQATNRVSNDCDIVVASIPTIGRSSSRIEKFDPRIFDCVIIDEAHHISHNTQTYIAVLNYFQPKLLIGLTATPKRTSGEGLGDFFNKIVYRKDLLNAITSGWLVPINAYKIKTNTDLTGVKKTAGDYAIGELQERVNDSDRNDLIVQSYKKSVDGSSALGFCAGIEHAETLATVFKDYGYDARCVFGHTDIDERRETIDWFAKTSGAILLNFAIVSEGVNIPSIETILMARPTQSNLLFQQMIGRGCRPPTGISNLINDMAQSDRVELLKSYPLTVIDVTDNHEKHTLITTATLFGLPPKFNVNKDTLEAVVEYFSQLKEEHPTLDFSDCETPADINLVLETVDLFEATNNTATNISSFNWLGNNEHYLLTIVGDKQHKQKITVEQNVIGNWDVVLEENVSVNVAPFKIKTVTHLGEVKEISDAIEISERYVVDHYAGAINVLRKDAGWRRKPASANQISFLQKKGVLDKLPTSVRRTLRKGDASKLIDAILNKR